MSDQSDQVISLTSSDDEDSTEPPPKKRKVSPILPECTVTLVSPKPTDSALTTIETVSLDSDDEISEDKHGANETSKSGDNIKKPVKTNSTDNVDLISLIDDEEDNIQTKGSIKVNGTNILDIKSKLVEENAELHPDTVSIIDDSDTEIGTNKELGNSNDAVANIKKAGQAKEKNNHSIIIDDSDDETEKENHCEYEAIESFPVHIDKTSASEIASASTSKLSIKHLDAHKYISNSPKGAPWSVRKELKGPEDELEEAKGLFKKFVRIIEEKIVDSSFEEILPKKVPIIKKYFNRSGTYVNDKAFKNLLVESIERIKKSTTANGANSAVLAFHKVFEHLKSHVAETTIVVEEDNLPKIKKLEHTIKLLRKRIHQLEVAEVNFDDDEDSAYIMLDRYQSRLKKVYAKYCQYINRNPHSGRATYDRITFVNSSYNEINQAITRKYKNSLIFPSYYELENYVQKISKKEKLNLSDSDIKIESRKCFKVLGHILQKKRRQELYDSHLDFVESSEDPATKDISLENVLKKNHIEGQEKIDKLYQKYVNKQERGEDHISSDEEQSSDESNDEENKDKKGKAKKITNVKIKKRGNKAEKGSSKDKENNVEENVESKNVQNTEFKNEIQKDKTSDQNDNLNLDDNLKIQKDEQLEIVSEKELNNKQDNLDKSSKNRTELEKDKIETQEDFLSILNMQKQTVEDPRDQDDITNN